MCEENSVAKQMNIPCSATQSNAAQMAWELAEKQKPQSMEYGSALNLAMILDEKSIAPLLLSLALDSKMDSAKRKAAAQALHIASFRGYKLNPDFRVLIQQRCRQGDQSLQLLCRE